jgi:hypothetical protein
MTGPVNTFGHADSSALLAAERLERALRADVDLQSLLDLAQLWIEPMHREEDAVALVAFVLQLFPDHPRAAVLSAYLALHYWMDDDSLRQAEGLLRRVLAQGHEVGAAAFLLDEILRRLGPDIADANIDLLRQSVAAEPSWSINHVRLARALAARGDTRGAIAELNTAIDNRIESHTPLGPLLNSYHEVFTGQLNLPDSWIEQRDRLAAGLS